MKGLGGAEEAHSLDAWKIYRTNQEIAWKFFKIGEVIFSKIRKILDHVFVRCNGAWSSTDGENFQHSCYKSIITMQFYP